MTDVEGTMLTSNKLLRRALLTYSVAGAFLPLLIFKFMVSSRTTPSGGISFNPVTLAAYLWLIATIGYWRATGRKKSLALIVLFPIAFGIPFIMFLFSLWGSSGAR